MRVWEFFLAILLWLFLDFCERGRGAIIYLTEGGQWIPLTQREKLKIIRNAQAKKRSFSLPFLSHTELRIFF